MNADFNYNGTTTDTGNMLSGSDTRVFLASYFVLDVTNPEKDPILLWSFSQRPGPDGGCAGGSARESLDRSQDFQYQREMVRGIRHRPDTSGRQQQPDGKDVRGGSEARTVIYRDQSNVRHGGGHGPSAGLPCIAADTANSSNDVRVFSTAQAGSSMGNAMTLDFQLDYRVDAVYAGTITCTGGTPTPAPGLTHSGGEPFIASRQTVGTLIPTPGDWQARRPN